MEMKQLVDKFNTEWEAMKALMNGEVEEQKAKFGTVLGDTSAKLDAFNSRLDQIELRVARPNAGDGGAKDDVAPESKARMAAFGKFLRQGKDMLADAERKLMTVVDDSTGGWGAPSEFSAEIIKGVIEYSPVRSFVRVRNTSKRSVKVMKRTGTFAAVWVGEQGTRTETTGLGYGLEEIPTHELYALVDISNQDLEDNDFNLESELRGEFAEQFAKAEAVSVMTGNGVAKPEGILSNAAVATDITGAGFAAALSYDGLVSVSHNGKQGYLSMAQFLLNLKSLGAIRKMKDGQGQPLWAPMVAGAPSTILGFPYTIAQDMPDVAAQATPVAFGAFQRAYQLVDRISIEISRDPFTQATAGAVRFIARKRLGGQVVLAEAIRKLKCSEA